MASRLATTIYYIEDPDSLRFALSVYDEYDVAALQPHFPGYPVFWAAAKLLYLVTGNFAVAFSLVGGLATFAVAAALLRMLGADLDDALGRIVAVLVACNPLFWLMANRYMPDLAGLAVALAAFYFLVVPGGTRFGGRAAGFLLVGLLAGIRLSFVPFVLVPALVAFVTENGKARGALAAAAGAAVWLVPMVIDTGWGELVAAAGRQAEGHFTEFGGTIETNPDLSIRLFRTLEAVWADGLGGYWWARHPLTGLVGFGLAAALAAGMRPLVDRLRQDGTWQLHVAAWFVYGVWMLFFQNVIYKSRHVLPLLPLILLVAGLGTARLIGAGRRGGQGAAGWMAPGRLARLGAVAFLGAYAAVGTIMAIQHLHPSAAAQAKTFIESGIGADDAVVSIPLINYYLAAQGVDAEYVAVEDTAAVGALRGGRVYVVGSFPALQAANPAASDTFYHNPYVNRMWPEVQVSVYDRNE